MIIESPKHEKSFWMLCNAQPHKKIRFMDPVSNLPLYMKVQRFNRNKAAKRLFKQTCDLPTAIALIESQMFFPVPDWW